MRIDEILSHEPLQEMSYSRKKAEVVITGLEKPINDHLLKILLVDAKDYAHWAAELLEWLDEVAEIRLKPGNKPGPKTFYYRILFDEPFGGAEVENVARRVRRILRRGIALRRNTDIEGVAEELHAFHTRFAEACSKGVDTGQVEALIGRLIPQTDIHP
jgi:hypothetical protein